MTRLQGMSHAALCELLGVPADSPRPDWLPYAVQATRVEILVNGVRLLIYGGAMLCGGCGFGLPFIPGPGSGTQHEEPEALVRCPKCGYGGEVTSLRANRAPSSPSPSTFAREDE